jgi:dynein heavy chain, axonemal
MMYMSKFSIDDTLGKRVNLSSATTPQGFQKTIEGEVERKTGKTFCPPGGKRMVIFIDDISMPLINKWGDQATLEIVRQLIETGGFYFLDKDKRGDFKTIERLAFIGAMGHPGGGRNDIPNRSKSKFLAINMVAPTMTSVDNIYGNIMRVRFNSKTVLDEKLMSTSRKLTMATISLWEKVKKSLLPTPQRFHYTFNMRELSRVFQGIMESPTDVIMIICVSGYNFVDRNKRVSRSWSLAP